MNAPPWNRDTPLFGRAREIELIWARLEAAAAGGGSAVLIGGEPGLGKSRLLREAAAKATEEGWLVLKGHFYEGEGMPPYTGFVEAIRRLRHVSGADAFEALTGAYPGVLTLLPESTRPHEVRADAPGRGGATGRYALFEAVADFLLSTAVSDGRRGLLLCLDDLQWADAASLQLCLHLLRRTSEGSLLVLSTYRTTEVVEGHPLFDVLAEVRRERLAVILLPASLSEEETLALAAALSSESVAAEVGSRLWQETRGNPFFIEEIVQHLLAGGSDLASATTASTDWGVPEGVRQVIGHRLGRMSAGARTALDAAAVLGDGFDVDLLPLTAGMGVEAASEALEEIGRAGLVFEAGTEYRFGHPLIRDTVYRRLGALERQSLHHRAVQAIESVHAANLEPQLAALATHCRLSGHYAEGDKTVDYLMRASRQARDALALEQAVSLLEAVLAYMRPGQSDPERRADLLVDLSALMYRAEIRHIESAAYLEEAIRLFDECRLAEKARSVRLRLAGMLTSQRSSVNIPRAIELCEEAESTLPVGDDPAAARLLATKAFPLGIAMRVREAVAAARRALALAEGCGDETILTRMLSYCADQFAATGEVDTALALCQHQADLGERLKDAGPAWQSVQFRTFFLCIYLADPVAAEELCRRYLANPMRLHSAGVSNAIIAYTISGQLDEAQRLLRRFDRQVAAEDWLYDFWTSDTSEACESALAGLVEAGRRAGDRWAEAHRSLYLALSRSARGATTEAEEGLRFCLAVALEAPHLPLELAVRFGLTKVLAAGGELEEAATHLARAKEIASGRDWRGNLGRLALAEACLRFAQGRHEQAEAQLQQAIEVFRRFSLVWDEAEALHVWGRALARRRGSHARAIEKLDEAASIYRQHGAGRRWAESVEADLSRLTGSGAALAHPDSLSQREVEVLRLIAAGKSNREIAEDLVLSVRTVERHIANVYAKAGLRTKAQATAYAHQKHLV